MNNEAIMQFELCKSKCYCQDCFCAITAIILCSPEFMDARNLRNVCSAIIPPFKEQFTKESAVSEGSRSLCAEHA